MARQATARARAPLRMWLHPVCGQVILGMAAILALVISGLQAWRLPRDRTDQKGGKYKSYGVSAEMRKAIALIKQEAFADALPFCKRKRLTIQAMPMPGT